MVSDQRAQVAGAIPSEYDRQNHIAKLGWIGATVLLVAGFITIVIGLFAPVGIASFGWFAYQPLANATFTPVGSAVVLSPVTIAGWAIFAVALIALAFLAGRVSGRRSSHGA